MEKWVAVFNRYPNMVADNETYLEEALLTVYYWQAVHETNGKTPAQEYPLRRLWEANADRRGDVQREFLMDTMRARTTN